MSEYTPTVEAFRGVYGEMCAVWCREDALAEFDRFIARIQAEAAAEALRGLAAEVADALKEGGVSARQGSRMQYAVGLMTASADQIEKEAGL